MLLSFLLDSLFFEQGRINSSERIAPSTLMQLDIVLLEKQIKLENYLLSDWT